MRTCSWVWGSNSRSFMQGPLCGPNSTEMSQKITLKSKWDQRYRSAAGPVEAAAVLQENAHLLPTVGCSLDLACGLGGNALLLAKQGLESHAWDLSSEAVAGLGRQADALGLSVHTQVRDVEANPPGPAEFDVLVVAHFLDRELFPALIRSLRPGGLLFYQTFSREAVTGAGPSNPQYRLAPNELLGLCTGLVVRVYREEGKLGDPTQGFRDRAMLVAERLG